MRRYARTLQMLDDVRSTRGSGLSPPGSWPRSQRARGGASSGRDPAHRPGRRRAWVDALRPCSLLGRACAYAYVPAVVTVAIIRTTTGADLAHAWATSPDRLAEGQWWTLLTSALVLDRVEGLQLVLVVVLVVALVRRHGPGALWAALLLGHVASTLLAYAGIHRLWDLHDDVASNADFGISCVWLTALALLIGDVLLTYLPKRLQTWVAATTVALAYIAISLAICATAAQFEHCFAILAGVGTALWRHRPFARYPEPSSAVAP